ncbi:MAG: glycosyltransferase [Myxococcales bacterium]|nr:glycosyltransferase [Myxococcales bacterium]
MTRPIRVLHVIASLEMGGEQRYLVRLANRLDPAVFEQLVVYSGEDALRREFGPQVRFRTLGAAVPTVRHPADLRAVPRMARLLRAEQIDVVTTHGSGLPVLAAKAAAFVTGRPVIHTIQRPYGNRSRTEDLTIRFAPLRRLVYGITDRYVALGSYYADDQITRWKIPRDKIVLNYIGLDLEEFQVGAETRGEVRRELGLPDAAPIVGIVARQVPVKGIARGLRVFAALLARMPQARLLNVGDGPQRVAFEVLARELGIAHAVLFAGSRPDSTRLMSACDIVLQTTHNPLNGISSIEAMAVGRPIATIVDSEDEERMAVDTCDEARNGCFVRTFELERAVDALAAALADPARLERMGQESRRMAEERFELGRHVAALAALYRELAGRREPDARDAPDDNAAVAPPHGVAKEGVL